MNKETAAKFFDLLYQDNISDDANLVIWANGPNPNVWCRSIEHALETLDRDEYRDRSYFGLALQDKERMAAHAAKIGDKPDLGVRRGYAQSASWWPGVGLDLDIRVDGKQKNYPPTIEDVEWMLEQLPMKPSMIVTTGGGIHAYWLLDEAYEIENSDELERIRRISYGWYLQVLEVARSRDWTIDNTSDLARVLRVPGSLNTKYQPAVEVSITMEDGPRYNLDDFEVHLPQDLSVPVVDASVRREVNFDIDEKAHPPLHLIEAACENDAKFELTWKWARKEPWSQSEYDLSIANFGVSFGWSDQVIVDAMIYHRAKHKRAVPKLRADYYADRLDRARASSGMQGQQEVLERLVERGSDPTAACAEKEMTIDDINALVDLKGDEKIREILKYPGDPPIYKMRNQAGELLTLGTVRNIISCHLFREAIAAVCMRVIPKMKDDAWTPIAQAILHATKTEDLGPDTTPSGDVFDSLLEYLEGTELRGGDDMGERSSAVKDFRPFVMNGHLYFNLRKFMHWLRTHNLDRVTKHEVCQNLREAGAESSVVRYHQRRLSGSVTPASKRFWRIPVQELKGAEAAIHWPSTGSEPVGHE